MRIVKQNLAWAAVYNLSCIPLALMGLLPPWLAGLGMRSAAGALAVAVGWFISSFVLSLPTGGGSVIITNTSAGLWYLYGGAVVALAAVVLAYLVWSRPGTARR